MSEQGRKNDAGKLRYDLIPAKAWQEVVKAITYGASKYGDDNWKRVPNGRQRFYAADMRHTEKWRIGEEIYDPESKAHHLACSITNLLFILEKELQGWKDVEELNEFQTEEDFFGCTSARCFGAADDNEDISEDTLKNYLNTLNVKVVDDKFQVSPKLWYPLVEDGGNPWIEHDGSGQPVSNEVVVEILYRYEREGMGWYECCERAKCWEWVWSDTVCDQIVAYRIVD